MKVEHLVRQILHTNCWSVWVLHLIICYVMFWQSDIFRLQIMLYPCANLEVGDRLRLPNYQLKSSMFQLLWKRPVPTRVHTLFMLPIIAHCQINNLFKWFLIATEYLHSAGLLSPVSLHVQISWFCFLDQNITQFDHNKISVENFC